jgi:hypothetical protein
MILSRNNLTKDENGYLFPDPHIILKGRRITSSAIKCK